MSKRYFVTGIGTEVGKTVISAALVEGLGADYWKPVQAGELDNSDTNFVKGVVTNESSSFHEERYRLKTPCSPHQAAEIDGMAISVKEFTLPETSNTLIIEGAGGLLVPLNQTETVADLISHFSVEAILVSSFYLGSINHTLLSVELLKTRGVEVAGIVFNGELNQASADIIEEFSGLRILGFVPGVDLVDSSFVRKIGSELAEKLG